MSYFTQDNTFVDADRFVRVVWTAAAAAGSPSFTFAVTGEAV